MFYRLGDIIYDGVSKITVVAKLQFLTDDVDVDILTMIWDWKRSRS